MNNNWRQTTDVRIRNRPVESVRTILLMAADALTEGMKSDDEVTKQLILELDELRKLVY